MEELKELFSQRKKKFEELIQGGFPPYPNTFRVSHTAEEISRLYRDRKEEDFETLTDRFSVAGRLMRLNHFGKAAFGHIQDRTGRVQGYFRRDRMSEKSFQVFSRLDIGDIVGVQGRLFRTRTGELTIMVEETDLLAKSFRPLPEKWHGLTDLETRYRQRYVDLIMNPHSREVFIIRSRAVDFLRRFLTDRGFLEVETPMMQPIPGGAKARPFKTHHNTLNMDLYLRVAPELYLKRLVVAGLERVFEINRNFRNEGISTQHNPEFTMLEFYQAYATYQDLMDLTEQMFFSLVQTIKGGASLDYQGTRIDFQPPWRRLSIREGLLAYGELREEEMLDREKVLAYGKKMGLEIKGNEPLGKLWVDLFEKTAEPHLIQPTFVTEYPIEDSPLARRNDQKPDFVDRFELYISGREIANAFSELNDPQDQKARFLEQAKAKARGDEEAHFVDEDYVRALEYGMPPAAGEGIGVDRLVMLLTDSPSIRDVILFPQMRPEKD
ncbi:MAG: lysine--tRNA ligase [Syntrophaceae bacterium]|nr:lysine--tRNA ligase [Syntrophaceae bacterium]